jgi:hypothetical protein
VATAEAFDREQGAMLVAELRRVGRGAGHSAGAPGILRVRAIIDSAAPGVKATPFLDPAGRCGRRVPVVCCLSFVPSFPTATSIIFPPG